MVPAVVPMMVPVGVPHAEPPRLPPPPSPPCYDIGMGCFPVEVCKLLTSEQCLSIPMASQACPRSCGLCGPKAAAGTPTQIESDSAKQASDESDQTGADEPVLNPNLKRFGMGGIELKPSPSPISQEMSVVTPIPTPSPEQCKPSCSSLWQCARSVQTRTHHQSVPALFLGPAKNLADISIPGEIGMIS